MSEPRMSNIAIMSIKRETTNLVEENMIDIIVDKSAKKKMMNEPISFAIGNHLFHWIP